MTYYVLTVGFANPAVFSKLGFSGLESSKPGFRVMGLPMTDGQVTLRAWQQSSPSRHPTVGLLIFRCQTAFHVQERCLLCVLHQQLETEHKKVTENIIS